MGIITNSISGSAGGQISLTGSLHMGGAEVLSSAGEIKRVHQNMAGDGLAMAGNKESMSVNVKEGIEINGDSLRISAFAAGNGLAGGGGAALSVNVKEGISIDNDSLRLDPGAAGDGLGYSAGVLSVGVKEGIETNGDSLRISAFAAGDGLAGGGGAALSVNVKEGVEINGDSLRISAFAAGNGLAGGGGAALSVNVKEGISIDSDSLRLDPGAAGDGLAYSAGVLSVGVKEGIETNGDSLRISSFAAGDGLAGGGGSALSVNVKEGIEINADSLRISAFAAGNGLAGGGGQALAVDLTASSGLQVNADGLGLKYQGGDFEVDNGGMFKIKNGGVSNDQLDGSIANDKLANSTISGKALGASLDALTHGAGISALNYNGSSAVQIAVDESWVRQRVSVTDVSGDGSLAYDNSTGVITYTGPSAAEVRAHFSPGTGVTYSAGQFSIGQPVATSDSVTFDNLTLNGDLTVLGDAVEMRVSELAVEDKTITVASGAANAGAIDGSAVVFGQDAQSYQLKWAQASSSPGSSPSLQASASAGYFDIVADKFHGDGSQLTGIAGSAISSVAGAISNDADNRVFTARGDGGFNGEANLTFDGSLLTVSGNTVLGANASSTITLEGATTAKADIKPQTNNSISLGASDLKWSRVYAEEVHAGDLCMQNARGAWRLIEESEFLTLRNEKTGKRYKFNMTLLPEDQWDPDGNWEG